MIYSPDLLKLMGISIAADLINQTHVSNEQKLWRHVILIAMEDVRATTSDRKTSIFKFNAHHWILYDKDFEIICWWANWDPEEVRFQYKKALSSLAIKFTYRQIAWKHYYDLYKKLKEAKQLDERKYLRQKVEEARRAVMNAKTVAVTTFFILPTA
ncbi:MAG: hypothetical protein O3A55_07800 [Bacteroidetes bacterium]|nr:hypothetical protein [Bacteroidota bacterium]